jgi:hypothetical protein
LDCVDKAEKADKQCSAITSLLYVCLKVFGLGKKTTTRKKRKYLMAEGLSLSSDGTIFRVRSSVGPVALLLENLFCGTPM